MSDRIQFRRDTAERWAQFNPFLLEGEIGVVLDNPNQYKIGDGVHYWNDLPLRGFNGNVVDEKGDSEDAVMSQKAVTDAIDSNTAYLYCTSNAGDNKVVQNTGFDINNGIRLLIKMQYANTKASDVTLQVGTTDAKPIIYNGAAVTDENTWDANDVLDVYYDGNNYQACLYSSAQFSTGEKVKNVGIDNEPIAESDNLVKSGGVHNEISYTLSLAEKNRDEYKTLLTGSDSVYIKANLERGDICSVKNLSSASCSVYLKDFYGNIVQTISAGTLLQNESIDFQVDTDDAVTIGGYCSSGYKLEFSLKSSVSLNSLNSLSLDLSLDLAKQYIYNIANDTTINLVEDKIIASSGIVMSGAGSAFHVSDSIAITSGEKLNILASALYGNCYYAIYDENNNVLLCEAQIGSVYEKQITVIAPYNSHHICISWVGGYTRSSLFVAEMVENGKSLFDIKWVCFGDSLTEINSNAKKKYYNYAQEELGISPLVYGVSGTGYFKNYGAGNNNFLTRIEQLVNVDFDIITFFGSFNDLDGGWIGGSIDSTDTTNNDICGFINATLNRLYEIKPFVKVGIITPTPWYNSFTLPECSEYATKLKQIAEKRSIPCLDLFRNSNLHPDKENFREKFYNEDGVQDNGTHPNSLGHLRIYPKFREFLKSML